MTNGDRIRQMSNEELAKWLSCSYYSIAVRTNGECLVLFKKRIKAYLDMEVE
jgi:hypothetical protein